MLATVLALGLLYLVGANALAALNPIAATQVVPPQYSRLLRLRLYELLLPGRRVTPGVVELANRTAVTEPLAFEPYFAHARAAEQAGRLPEAIRMMEEARRRRTNFVPTRLQLAAYYTRANRPAEAFGEIQVLLSLMPTAIDPVMAELTKLVPSREGREVLATALATNPPWRPQFFAVARGRAIRPELALALLEEVRARRPRGGFALEQQLYIQSLIDAGQMTRAHELWLGTLPQGERDRNRLLANSGFRGRPAAPPFGWALQSLDVGRAEIRDANGLQPFLNVDYFGGSNALLAEQMLALPAGTYRLRYRYKGESGATATSSSSGSSSIFWSLVCASGSPELARRDMNRPTRSYRADQAAFTVPGSGCDGQRLRLVAEAGDVPAVVNLNIAGLEIVR